MTSTGACCAEVSVGVRLGVIPPCVGVTSTGARRAEVSVGVRLGVIPPCGVGVTAKITWPFFSSALFFPESSTNGALLPFPPEVVFFFPLPLVSFFLGGGRDDFGSAFSLSKESTQIIKYALYYSE